MTYASPNEVSTETLAMQDVEKSANQVICEQIWLEEAVSQYEKKIDEINQKYDKEEENKTLEAQLEALKHKQNVLEQRKTELGQRHQAAFERYRIAMAAPIECPTNVIFLS